MIDLNNIEYHLTNTWPSFNDISKEHNVIIADFMKKIYSEGIFLEINRLLTNKEYPNCGGIGHVVLISICSAIDSLSTYANGGGDVGQRFTSFISKYFPSKYSGKENFIYKSFRCDGVHGWNLHKSIISGNINDPEHLLIANGIISISLYDFFNDLIKAFNSYYELLKIDDNIKNNFLIYYKKVKK